MSDITVSLSKPSLSSNSLNTLPFIPPYLRNTPLDIYNKTAKDPIFLPTQWNLNDSSIYIEVMDNGLGLRCIGKFKFKIFLEGLLIFYIINKIFVSILRCFRFDLRF